VDPQLEANRANWDDRVGIHVASTFYDVEGWLKNAQGPPEREVLALGSLAGKSLLHLQCHFGMDTLRWARSGATVTGVDFSPAAVNEATALAKRAGLSSSATFVCSNVYDAPEALSGERFDVLYVSLGSLAWLPDIAQWGDVVSRLLLPGGRVYIHDVHPFTMMFDDDAEHIINGYFEDQDNPIVEDDASTYTDGGTTTTTRTYEWSHSLGEVVMSLTTRGLVVDSLVEHDWTLYQAFSWLIESPLGTAVIPEGRPRIPLSFTLVAHAPA
jgi:SAM-dependent methyltransferase